MPLGHNLIPKAFTIVPCLLVRGRYARRVRGIDRLQWTAKVLTTPERAKGNVFPSNASRTRTRTCSRRKHRSRMTSDNESELSKSSGRSHRKHRRHRSRGHRRDSGSEQEPQTHRRKSMSRSKYFCGLFHKPLSYCLHVLFSDVPTVITNWSTLDLNGAKSKGNKQERAAFSKQM